MKLYALNDQSGVYTEAGSWTVGKDGTIDVPDDIAVSLRDTPIVGVKGWEDENERHARLEAEQLAQERDPATLLAAVKDLRATVSAPKAPRAPAAKKAAPETSAPAVKKAPAPRKAAAKKAPAAKPAAKGRAGA